MNLIAIDTTTGNVVEKGSTVVDFRGDTRVLSRVLRARGEGFSGKIVLDENRELYDKVADLAILDLDDASQYLGELPEAVVETYSTLAGR